MINKKILVIKLRDFAINYDVQIKPGYVAFMEKALTNEGFDDNDFVAAINSIMRTEVTTYGKMPSLAMFINAKPKKITETKPFKAIPVDYTISEEDERKIKEKINKLPNTPLGVSLKKLGLTMITTKKK